MKNVSQVNGGFFRQAVVEMSKSNLYPIKIQLSDELKEGTLKVFTENVEAVPVEKEAEIAAKIVEMYNFIVDDEYQIPEGIFEEEAVMEEQVVTEQTDEGIVVESTETPVSAKEKREHKPKAPKVPKEPKIKKERKPRPPTVPNRELSRKQKVYAKWVENKEMTPKEMLEVCPDLSLQTIVSWRYTWKNGSNLPKGAVA